MLLHFHRIQHWLHRKGIPLLPKLIKGLIFLLFGCVFPPEVKIGSGTRFWHHGLGVILHPGVEIGDNCNIYNHVVMGGAHDGPGGLPVKIIVENNVNIGAGACILCKEPPLTLARGTTVAANSVVLDDTEESDLVAGLPAVKIKSTHR